MGTVATAVMIGSSLYTRNKALTAQGRANAQTAKNYITSMNFNLQNLEQQRSDAFDATVNDLQKIRLQGNRQIKNVEAAVNEELAGGGRTADLVKRGARADLNRAVESNKDNYARRSNEIDLNKEATVRNTSQQINSMAKVEKPSFFSTLLDIGTSYLGAKQTGEAIKAIQHTAGVGVNHTPVQSDGARYSILNRLSNTTPSLIQSVAVDTDWLQGQRRQYTFYNPYSTNESYFKP